jgi:hypothetical protein
VEEALLPSKLREFELETQRNSLKGWEHKSEEFETKPNFHAIGFAIGADCQGTAWGLASCHRITTQNDSSA